MRDTTKIMAHLLLGIAVAGAVACSGAAGTTGPGGGTEPPDAPGTPSVGGTYTLKLVNGNPVPALLWHDDTAYEMDAEMYILSGSIVLRADGTFRSTSVSQLLISGDEAHPGSEQVSTSITDGTYLYVHDSAECETGECVYGDIQLTAENGGQGTVSIAGAAIVSKSTIPGAPGEPDMEVYKIFER